MHQVLRVDMSFRIAFLLSFVFYGIINCKSSFLMVIRCSEILAVEGLLTIWLKRISILLYDLDLAPARQSRFRESLPINFKVQ